MKPLFAVAVTLAGSVPAHAAPVWTGEDYPPCSKHVIDRCVQTHEARDHAPANAEPVTSPAHTGMGGPYEPVEEHLNAAPDYGAALPERSERADH